MWLAIRDLCTGVRAQVLYSGSLSKTFDISQGTGQGRILAPFMYKVYINGLLRTLTQYSCALSINSLRLTSPSCADDISLLALHPTFLRTFMNIYYEYSVEWRYEFNHVKSGFVTLGEAKRVHCQCMNERASVDELYGYKNLGVVKIYIGSFSSNADENIDKTRKKRASYFLRILIAEKLAH